MMRLSSAVMSFFANHTGAAILSVFLVMIVSLVIIFLRHFAVMYRPPQRYLMGLLSLIVTVSIFLLASPFWAVAIKGYSNFLTFIATVALFVLVAWNLLLTAEFFTGKKILKALCEALGRKYE